MIQEFYCTNIIREYTNIPSCSGKLVFDSSRLQEGIFVYTLVKLYNKANILISRSSKGRISLRNPVFNRMVHLQLIHCLLLLPLRARVCVCLFLFCNDLAEEEKERYLVAVLLLILLLCGCLFCASSLQYHGLVCDL